MGEGLFVMLDAKAHEVGMEKFNKMAKLSLFKNTGAEMRKAIFFSKLIIITCLVPIFSFQKVEGKMFSPLAWTLGFALLGALILYVDACSRFIVYFAPQKRQRKTQFLCRRNYERRHGGF